jgi:hypothetical protein
MAMLKFLKGNYAGLSNAAIAEGQVLICGDTGEMFVDVAAGKRVKIGDFTIVANTAALDALDASTIPTTRLYYVEEGNILARFDGTSWSQINKQLTADQIKTMISLSSYETKADAAQKLVDAKAYTDQEIGKVNTYIGTIPTDEKYADIKTIVGYVNKKAEETLASAQGGSSETAASVKAALDTYKETNDAAVKANTDAITAIKDGTTIDSFAAVEAALDGKQAVGDYATKAEAQGYANAKDEAISAAQAKADEAYELAGTKTTMAAVEEKGYQNADQVQAIVNGKDEAIAAAKKAGDDAQDAVDALAEKVGDVAEGKTVVEMIAEAQDAATYDDKEVRGLISDNADAIAAEKERAEGVEEGLQNQINLIMNNPDTKDVIDSIAEFTQYVADHGTIANGFRTDIDKNKEDIAAIAGDYLKAADKTALQGGIDAVAGRMDTAEGEIDALQGASHTHGNATVLNGITAEKVAAWDAAEANAEAHADGLNSAMDTRVKALEAIDHDHINKAELDLIVSGDKAKWDAAAAKAHEHVNSAELAKITDGDVAKWNGAQAAAEATAAGALASAKSELEGKITSAQSAAEAHADAKVKELADGAVAQKANSADVYKKTETYTQAEVDAAIAAANSWGSF